MRETLNNGRNPWIAAVLSLFCTGLGHVYCGRIGKGLTLFFLSLVFAPSAIIAALIGSPSVILIGVILPFLVVICIYLYAVIDSYRIAGSLREDYRPKDYNRGVIYAFFILAGLVCPASFAMLVRADFMQAYYIPASSMAPTILEGDRLLVNKMAYRRRPPNRGDVVVLSCPDDKRVEMIKRVIALPGDTVAVVSDEVYIDGTKLPREKAPPSDLPAILNRQNGEAFYETNAGKRYAVLLKTGCPQPADFQERRVPEGFCFVLGDNRDRSKDSRCFGFVPLKDITGAGSFIHYPVGSWKRFGAIR